ncbi:MAG: DUF3791 domain-containing protein [Spirochaetales bacterium]|nr:DUF3791 domain-containing protein [Spirochaetia bacterium]MDD7014517.1 DUF3791 domain-containing protein [Spirochaetales bacterium]
MSKETSFFIYLIERYAEYKNTTAEKIIVQWEKLGLVDFIYNMYELYHTERIENAYMDIDSLMQTGKTAW